MALYDVLDGLRHTAPSEAMQWFERMKFCHDHPAYKFSDFDSMTAADYLSDCEYHAMTEATKGSP